MKMSIDLTIFAEREQKEITYDGKDHLATPIACDDGYFMGVGLGFEEIEEEIRAGNIQLTPAVESYFMEFQRYKLGK